MTLFDEDPLTLSKLFFVSLSLVLAQMVIFCGSAVGQDKTLSIAFGMDKAPFLFSKGTQQGLEIDIICKAFKNQGYQCQPKQMPQALLHQALADNPNLAASAGIQAKTGTDYFYSDVYINYEHYVISRTENDLSINSIEDLTGKRIGVYAGAHTQLGEAFQRLFSPHERAENAKEFYEINDHSKLISLLFNRSIDVLIVDKTVFNWYRNLIAPNIYTDQDFQFHDVLPELTGLQVAFGSAKLRDTFNLGLNKLLDNGRYEQLITHYLTSKGVTLQRQLTREVLSKDELYLTSGQKRWLKFNPRINFTGDPAWLPFEGYNDKGEYVGIVADHLSLIEKKLGVFFTKHQAKSWDQALMDILENDKNNIDVLTSSISNQKLYHDFVPVQPFITNPVVIVQTEQDSFVSSLDELSSERIAVVHNASYLTEFALRYPNHNWQQVESMALGLEGVSTGKYDAMIVTMALANYHIGELGLYNLRIVGRTDFSLEITLFVNKAKPVLHSIINKALQSVTVDEYQAIQNRWIKQDYIEKTNYTVTFVVVIVCMAVLSIFLYWNRRLRYEITLRKQTEEQLKIAKENAEKATVAKSTFLSNMSHEIRTPMNAVLGFAELLSEEENPKQRQNFIKTIQSAGNALLTLINDILDLSKIEAGKMEIHQQANNPHVLFAEVASLFMIEIKKKQLELVLDIDKDIPRNLMLDTVRLRQILFNLIGNAVKFTEHGTIRLVARQKQSGESARFVDLIISVVDTGVGIAPEDMVGVFGAFEQSKEQDNRKYGGTGLGLAISQRLAKLMNGVIEVTSKQNQGTRFDLTLFKVEVSSHAAEPNRAPTQTVSSEQIRFKPSTVLVVDDVDINRNLVQECINDTELKFIGAASGEQALAILVEQDVDLILMDVKMPKMDGYEAATRAKALVDVPILALTATIMDPLARDFIDSAFDSYLKKPVFKRELYQALSVHLPYEVKMIEPVEVKPPTSIRMSQKAIEDSELIIVMLDQELLPLWQSIRSNNKMSEIKKFAEAIEGLGLQYDIRACRDYSATLFDTLNAYDIVGIKHSVQNFPVLSAMIKKHLS